MNLFAAVGLDRFNPTQGGVRGMRVAATGLLLAMAAIYLVARGYEAQFPAAGYVRAFAEAAMVGGLADWFAVTALFRHPLGLPIPHTAIIPRNKDRIGDALALFLRDNFLTARVVAQRMRGLDIAAGIGRWLAAPSVDERVRKGAGQLLGDIIEALADERLGTMVKGAIVGRLRTLDFAPVLGAALERAVDEQRHVPLLEALVRWANETLAANQDLIRQMVHEKAGAILRWTGLDERLAQAIIDGLGKLLGEMAENPAHPLRLKAEEGLQKLATDLKQDESMHDRVGRFRDAIISNAAVAAWIDGMWHSLRDAMLRAARDPNHSGSGRFGAAIRQLGETLQNDAALRFVINRFARRATVGMVARYGTGIVTLVSETVRSWDAKTVTGRLESAVGRDLQYIRINGTLVGGMVGFVLHIIDRLL
jgi:uncharacterized membrane-anchored protein YjiN (DUF445 family)